MRAVFDALGLPPDARVDARVPKKLLIEQGAPTPADKRAIQDGIDELQWFAACKPATIGVPSFVDDTREYLEIAVVGCAFRSNANGKPANAPRLIELIHRAIPYPVLLISSDDQGVTISASHKRRAQNDAGRTVTEAVTAAIALRPHTADAIEAAFLQGLALAEQQHTDLYILYDSEGVERSFAEQLEKNDAVKVYAKLPGWFKVPTPLGSYNPDWAILVQIDGQERVYFVVETKGSLFADDLREHEAAKIACGKAHFETLAGDEKRVRYIPATKLDDVLSNA
ncbi:MAG: DUF4391 domain-containing protein [Enhydrobacter sp.]|nr:DUF4391 domain-containing protein [Enhydrobacter sp.]